MKKKKFIIIVFIAGLLLLIPLIAMQFTTEVNWDFMDFVVAAILIIGSGICIEFVGRKVRKPVYKTVAIISVLIILLLLWAELAVGIFGTPLAGS